MANPSTPGDFKPAPTSPENPSGHRVETVVRGNLDGKPGADLAVVNRFASIAILANVGQGDFTEIGSYPVAPETAEMTAANLDGKNGDDLAVSSLNTGDVTILVNDGHGNFSEPATSPEAGTGGGITSADFNGDHKIDLAIGANGGPETGVVMLNDGNGDFTAGDSFSSPDTWLVENADLNGDGAPDVVGMGALDDAPIVSFNDGNGNMTDGEVLSGGGGGDASGIAVGRLGRGRSPDVALGTAQGIALYLNNGHGKFTPAPESPLKPRRFFGDLQVGDVNGDGRGDIVAGDDTANGERVAVFLSRRGGGFKEPATSPERVAQGLAATPWVAVGQFDRRAYPDIAVATGYAGKLSILLNRSPIH